MQVYHFVPDCAFPALMINDPHVAAAALTFIWRVQRRAVAASWPLPLVLAAMVPRALDGSYPVLTGSWRSRARSARRAWCRKRRMQAPECGYWGG